MQENNEQTGFLLCEYPPLHGSYLRLQAELSPWEAQNDIAADVGQPGKAAATLQNNTKLKAAFTLAEVLITLGIIGIVAAMTLPAVSNNMQKRHLKAGFNKAYSELSQVVLKLTDEYGDLDPVVFEVGAPTGYELAAMNLRSVITPHINCARNTIAGSSKTYFYDEVTYNYMNLVNDEKVYLGFVKPGHVICATTNGMLVSLSTWADNYIVIVDTNGYFKGPNRMGYDLFVFSITPKQSKLVVSRQEGLVGISNVGNYPCSYKYSGDFKLYNGIGCSYYALIDKNPDDETKGYWQSLP